MATIRAINIFAPNQHDNVYHGIAVVSRRAPTVNDKYEVGQIWIDKVLDDVYFMTSVTAGSAIWINVGGGAGVYASVTATTGDVTADAGDIVATLGDLSIVAGSVTFGALDAGTVRSSAAGLLSSLADGADGTVLIGTTGGAPAWATLTAGAGITIAEAAGTITITNPGATGTTSGTDVGGPVSPTGGGLTTFEGYDLNIQTDGATANTVRIRLADDVVTVASLTASVDFDMSAGVCTIVGSTDTPQSIYLHANGGVTETIDIHSDLGTAVNSVNIHSDVGGLTLASGLATTDAINITASAGGIDVDAADQINILCTENAADAIIISASAGGIDITGAGIAGEDIDISNTASVNLVSTEDAAEAIYLRANGGVSETIRIRSDLGTGATSIDIESDVGGLTFTAGLASNDAINVDATNGGFDVDAALQINLTSSQAAADAIVIDASDAAGGIDIDYGTGGMIVTGTNGAYSLITGTGTIDIGVDAVAHVITVGNVTGATQVDVNTGTGGFNVATTGAGDITLDSDDTFLIDADGVLELNSTGVIGIGSDADAFDMNIGTGAAQRVITIGNATSASQVVVDCGTAGVSIGESATAHPSNFGSTNTTSATTIQSGSGALTLTAGGIYDVNATGAVTIDSSGGTIGIGVDAVAQNINVGIGAAARVITMGNVTGATQVVLDCGTAGVSIGESATAHPTDVGSTNTTSATTLQSGTGAMTFTAGGIYDVNATDAVTIDSSGGTIGIGVDAVAQNINVGIGGAVRVITIGNVTGASQFVVDCGTAGVSIGESATAHPSNFGSTNTTSATTIQAGTGALTITAGGIYDVNATDAVTIDSSGGAISIGADAVAQAVNIGTGGAVRDVTVGSVNTTASTLIQSGTGDVTITSTDDIVHTASGDVTFNTDIDFITATTGVVFQEGPKLIAGAGSPNGSVTAPKGSMYLRTDGSGAADRAFINTDAGTTWTAISTAA